MHEFREDTRDIYKAQLFIDHKRREMRHLERQKKKAEQDLVEDIARLAELDDEYKLGSIRIGAAVARKARMVEVAMRTAVEKRKAFESAQQEVGMVRAAISKNEELLQIYLRYQDFLRLLCPADSDNVRFFSGPEVLMAELHRIEEENLFIIQHYDHMCNLLSSSTAPISDRLEDTQEQSVIAKEKLEALEEVREFVGAWSPQQQQDIDKSEGEYAKLAQLIKRKYVSCFRRESEVDALAMLGKFEDELERMYVLEEKVDPAFREEKRIAKLKKRREAHRLERHARKEAEMQRKLQHVMERAKRPIPRRSTKIPVERIVPVRTTNRATEQELLRRREELRLEHLLFEDSD
jgi:hypothetical protein